MSAAGPGCWATIPDIGRLEPGGAVQQLAQHDSGLQACQRGSHVEVHARPNVTWLLAPVRSRRNSFGASKCAGSRLAGSPHEQQMGIRGQLDAGQGGIAQDVPVVPAKRRFNAQRLFDDIAQQFGISRTCFWMSGRSARIQAALPRSDAVDSPAALKSVIMIPSAGSCSSWPEAAARGQIGDQAVFGTGACPFEMLQDIAGQLQRRRERFLELVLCDDPVEERGGGVAEPNQSVDVAVGQAQ